MMPSGHKAFLVHNTNDVDLLLMHNKTFAAEYVTNKLSRVTSNRMTESATLFRHERELRSLHERSSWVLKLQTRRLESRRKYRGISVGVG